MKFVFIAKHRNVWPVAWLCEALGVSRSGFHAWLTRSPSERTVSIRRRPRHGAVREQGSSVHEIGSCALPFPGQQVIDGPGGMPW